MPRSTPPREHRRSAGLGGALALAVAAGSLLAAPAAAAPAAPAPQAAPAAQAGVAQPPAAARGYAQRTLRRMTLEEKVGQLITGYAYGSSATTADPRNEALYGEGVATPADVVERYHLGGVIYFAWTDNVRNPSQTAALSNGLQDAALSSGAEVPLLISTDQEQGVVTRLGPPATALPGAMALGAGRSSTDARRAAAITGTELAAVGIRQDFAPVADVNVDPANPVIGVRSHSSDPQLAARMVTAQVRGFQGDAGVVATAKHFPGHGDTSTDSHVGLPVIDHTREEWERIDAPPFRAAVAAGVDSIMTAHIVVPSLDPSGDPATLSEPIITGVLRGELGYDGVVTTDSLEMAGVRQQYGDGEVAVRALEAGADVLLMPADPAAAVEAIHEALDGGRLTERRIDQSVRRVLELKHRRGVVQEPYADPDRVGAVVGSDAHRAEAQAISDRTVTVLRDDAGLLPLAAGARRVLVAGPGAGPTAALSAALGRRGHAVTTLETGTRPSDAALDAAAAGAARSDLVVVLTNKAWDRAVTDREGRQQRLVAGVVASGTPVVHVAVRDPYDVAHLPGATTSLATYSTTDVSMESVARVVTGEVAPHGRLPVDVPRADDPSQVLLPFGTGVTW
ncbi:glycoside hydrolase family 3 protein [Vallicoccus soli]|uniref:beta-N-acetylhexosaminidase n=1 Tax=Vallicoccus soli TaxID=2339232 RepID=A0A3A3Z131_9ACTN|nr:glycoside hydrolase family 3 protein [Vallicoccus soli]RJK97959.1 glycoside hydrolase family 3 protein [Vallicoccus soli]